MYILAVTICNNNIMRSSVATEKLNALISKSRQDKDQDLTGVIEQLAYGKTPSKR